VHEKGSIREKSPCRIRHSAVCRFCRYNGFAHDIDHIRAAIQEKGAHWEAGETDLSKLPDQERKLRLDMSNRG